MMIYITKKKYDNIHDDYKGIWTRNVITGTDFPPEWYGKKTVLSGCVSSEIGALLIEGTHFKIIKEGD